MIVNIISGIVVAFLVSFFTWLYKLGKITHKVESIKETVDKIEDRTNKKIERLEDKFDKFLLTLYTPENQRTKIMEPYLDKFSEILKLIKGSGNPISTEELGRLNIYRNKIVHREIFSATEYEDFKLLMKKVEREVPEQRKDEFDWVVAGLLGFIAGIAVASLFKK